MSTPLRTPEQWAAMVEIAIARAKAEILRDEANGTLPAGITDFAILHDHVDANEYGGLCDDGWLEHADDELTDLCNQAANIVQGAVHAWLQTRAETAVRQAIKEANTQGNYDITFVDSDERGEQ